MRYLAKSHSLFENAYSFAVANSWEQKFDTKLKDLATVKVRALAHQQVITVNIYDDLSEVCHILGEHRLKRLPFWTTANWWESSTQATLCILFCEDNHHNSHYQWHLRVVIFCLLAPFPCI